MELSIVCRTCHGSGVRVDIGVYVRRTSAAQVAIPRRCPDCTGSGKTTIAATRSRTHPDR